MIVELPSDIMVIVHGILELIPIIVTESGIIVMYPDITDVVYIVLVGADTQSRNIFMVR